MTKKPRTKDFKELKSKTFPRRENRSSFILHSGLFQTLHLAPEKFMSGMGHNYFERKGMMVNFLRLDLRFLTLRLCKTLARICLTKKKNKGPGEKKALARFLFT